MALKNPIYLSDEERERLVEVVKRGLSSHRTALLCMVLLYSDMTPGQRGGKTSLQISRELNISDKTIESLKLRYLEGGLTMALMGRSHAGEKRPLKLLPPLEEKVVELAASTPPDGRSRWTLRLLAEKLVESGTAPMGISPMSVQRVLKKRTLSIMDLVRPAPAGPKAPAPRSAPTPRRRTKR
jgi:transposase